MKNAIVLGGGGFIGGHLVKFLKSRNYWVRVVDLKQHQYQDYSDEFIQGDLTNPEFVREVLYVSQGFSRIYQLAADMGGAGYIFTGENDSNVMTNSALINLNVLNSIVQLYGKDQFPKVFYSSSACIYPEEKQLENSNPGLRESDAYPANPDSEYGWEKLFSERLYFAYNRNFGLPVRVARFHNIYGPEGTWRGGKEKAPAAICRKVAQCDDFGKVEIWGNGKQTRSFLYIDDCISAIEKFMESSFSGPLNIGSEEIVSINDLVRMVSEIAGKNIEILNIKGPVGVAGRNSNNELIREKLNWDYQFSLMEGMRLTFEWIQQQIKFDKNIEEGS